MGNDHDTIFVWILTPCITTWHKWPWLSAFRRKTWTSGSLPSCEVRTVHIKGQVYARTILWCFHVRDSVYSLVCKHWHENVYSLVNTDMKTSTNSSRVYMTLYMRRSNHTGGQGSRSSRFPTKYWQSWPYVRNEATRDGRVETSYRPHELHLGFRTWSTCWIRILSVWHD